MNFKEILFWVPVGMIPIFNGVIRLLTYQRTLGEPYSSFISSTFDIILIFSYSLFIQRRKPKDPYLRGSIWILLSTLNHFALGLLVFGMSFDQLISKYKIWNRETWSLITLFIFATPSMGQRFLDRMKSKSPSI